MTQPSHAQAPEPALIGVDWGTSSCRAYLIAADGRIISSISTPKGILHVTDGAFTQVLDDMIGAWRRPGLPVVLSGMIGSRQGWIEVPYLPVPANVDQIAAGMVRHPDDPDLHIAPGLAQDPPGQAPDVMRGEETQIIGATGAASGHRLLVMPGTHSKWVLIEDRTIVWFATFMTGELFAVLKDHSILGRLMSEDAGDHQPAFEQGLRACRTLPGGLLQHVFSARTLNLFERLPDHAIAAYLSGLLIGHEIQEALGQIEEGPGQAPISIIGASPLAERYAAALACVGIPALTAGGDVAAHGHHTLARAAGLVGMPMGET